MNGTHQHQYVQSTRHTASSKYAHKKQMTRLRTVWITEPSQNRFQDDYVILNQIGEPGQFGKAYRCKRKKDLKIFAVKEISKARIYRLSVNDKIRQSLLTMMKNEIDILRRLEHRYIVNLEETYETKHFLYIVMEECKGGELFDRIKDRKRYKERDAKLIIKQICETLFYMHDQHRVVHCDLKPDNILFADKSENSDIKIIDFGMSKVLPRLHQLRELCGTPYYTAPEVINGEYGHAADMWSVGVITYVMVIGFPPFYVDPNKYYGVRETKEIYKLILKGFEPRIKKGYGAWFPRNFANNLSKDCLDFISQLMEKDVAKRLTAREALQHDWLNKSSINDDNDEKQIVNVQQNMDLNALQFANFAVSHQFKFAITALFRDQYENMRPKHFEKLKELFRELDKDGNGKISYAEFEEGILKCKDLKLNRNQIQKMFSELDVNKLGQISFENLLNAAIHDYLIASDARLYAAFRDLDENESGKIEIIALKNKIRQLNPYGNIDVIFKIIDDIDENHDGTIDYTEFLHALHPNFTETPNWFWQNNDDKNKQKNKNDEIQKKKNSISKPTAKSRQSVPMSSASARRSTSKSKSKSKKKINPYGILKQGYMQKQGGSIKTWRKRWFILQNNGIVSYYHDKTNNKAIFRFDIKSATKIDRKSWSKTNKKRYGIKVYTPERDWKFLALNNDEREEWINAFKKAYQMRY